VPSLDDRRAGCDPADGMRDYGIITTCLSEPAVPRRDPLAAERARSERPQQSPAQRSGPEEQSWCDLRRAEPSEQRPRGGGPDSDGAWRDGPRPRPHRELQWAQPQGPGQHGGDDEPPPTTLVIRNLPAACTTQQLLDELGSHGVLSHVDFCYVPFNISAKSGKGFGFVNFSSAAAAAAFRHTWHGRTEFRGEALVGRMNVSPANVQGKEANAAAWRSVRGGRIKDERFRPFIAGDEAFRPSPPA